MTRHVSQTLHLGQLKKVRRTERADHTAEKHPACGQARGGTGVRSLVPVAREKGVTLTA